MAVWALVLALSPLLALLLGAFLEPVYAGGDPDAGEPELPALAIVLGIVGSILTFGGPIAGIAFGAAARRDPTADQASRNLALAAIIIGAATLGLYLVMAILLIILVAMCAAACASCGNSASIAAPCATLAARPADRRPRTWREALAHHPDLPVFGADVYRVAGLRLCVGCFTATPAFLLALAAAWLWPLPAAVAVPLGALLASAQALSAAGWTTTKARKAAVKASFGAGAGLLLHALLAAPWPEQAKSFALAAAGLLALASTWPRARRMERLAASAAA